MFLNSVCGTGKRDRFFFFQIQMNSLILSMLMLLIDKEFLLVGFLAHFSCVWKITFDCPNINNQI